MNSNQITAMIRTMAQALAGAIITWSAALPLLKEIGIELDQAQLESVIYMLVTGLWTITVAALEKNVHPMFGFLNIVRKQPTYVDQIDYMATPE